jgi:hypothetical protein
VRDVARRPPRRASATLVGTRPARLDCGHGQQWSSWAGTRRRPAWRSAAQRCGVLVGGTADVPLAQRSKRRLLSHWSGRRAAPSGASRRSRSAVRCAAWRSGRLGPGPELISSNRGSEGRRRSSLVVLPPAHGHRRPSGPSAGERSRQSNRNTGGPPAALSCTGIPTGGGQAGPRNGWSAGSGHGWAAPECVRRAGPGSPESPETSLERRDRFPDPVSSGGTGRTTALPVRRRGFPQVTASRLRICIPPGRSVSPGWPADRDTLVILTVGTDRRSRRSRPSAVARPGKRWAGARPAGTRTAPPPASRTRQARAARPPAAPAPG